MNEEKNESYEVFPKGSWIKLRNVKDYITICEVFYIKDVLKNDYHIIRYWARKSWRYTRYYAQDLGIKPQCSYGDDYMIVEKPDWIKEDPSL